ncbi:MAG: cbb3-type cytochrome oxidase assembly protein CcoS [Pseudomonadota bacterium]
MDVLLILVPCSLALGLLALVAFVWTLRAHQYDDLEGDSMRALGEHDTAPPPRD